MLPETTIPGSRNELKHPMSSAQISRHREQVEADREDASFALLNAKPPSAGRLLSVRQYSARPGLVLKGTCKGLLYDAARPRGSVTESASCSPERIWLWPEPQPPSSWLWHPDQPALLRYLEPAPIGSSDPTPHEGHHGQRHACARRPLPFRPLRLIVRSTPCWSRKPATTPAAPAPTTPIAPTDLPPL
jgi:hypothetical protein